MGGIFLGNCSSEALLQIMLIYTIDFLFNLVKKKRIIEDDMPQYLVLNIVISKHVTVLLVLVFKSLYNYQSVKVTLRLILSVQCRTC